MWPDTMILVFWILSLPIRRYIFLPNNYIGMDGNLKTMDIQYVDSDEKTLKTSSRQIY